MMTTVRTNISDVWYVVVSAISGAGVSVCTNVSLVVLGISYIGVLVGTSFWYLMNGTLKSNKKNKTFYPIFIGKHD